MLRAIILRKTKDSNGLETETYETVDFDCDELEEILAGGGYSEDSYDWRQAVGIEIIFHTNASKGEE